MYNKLTPPFKSPKNQYYTANLFYERWVELPSEDRSIDPQFSLYGGVPDVIDCKSTFIELGDPTGYKWAITYLQSWDHWLKLINSKSPWFRDAYHVWLEELKVKMKQKALETIERISNSGTPQSLPAAKYIAGAEWEHTAHTKGRPSKELIKGELAKAVKVINQEDEDIKRIGGLSVIQGGRI